MKRSFVLIMLIICFLMTGCVIKQKLTSLEGMPADVLVQKVLITGEDCGWSPDLVRIQKGTHVILEVESADWEYNFRVAHYGLAFIIPEGKKVTAEFYAKDEGEFEYGCYIETGEKYFWGGMIGKFVVE